MNFPWPQGDYFMPATCVGGNGGGEFLMCEMEKGRLVKKIAVYFDAHDKWIQGIYVTYTDNTESEIAGTESGSYKEITLEPGETIKQAGLWISDGFNNRVRMERIRIITNKNQTFSIGRETQCQNEHTVRVGSGYLAGFTGRCGIDIDKLAFIFLKPIKSVTMSNVNFVGPLPAEGISSHQLARSKFENNCERSADYNFTNSIEKTNSYSFTCSTSKQFPHNLKITAQIPKIIEVGGQFGWESGTTKSQEWSNSDKTTLSWSLSGTMNPGESVTCTASCQHGQADVDYTGRVTVAFARASDVWTYEDTGTLHNSIFAFTTAEAVTSKVSTAKDTALEGKTTGGPLKSNNTVLEGETTGAG